MKTLGRTEAYRKLQMQVQTSFDFGVAVAHAIPALDLQLDLVTKGKIQKPPVGDFFQYTIYYILNPSDFSELTEKGVSSEITDDLKKIENKRFTKYESFLTEIQNCVDKFSGNLEPQDREYYKKIIINVGTKGVEHLKSCYSEYKYKLAIYLYISTFSFFESFIQDIITEIIERNNQQDLYEFQKTYFAEYGDTKIQNLKEMILGETDMRHLDRYKNISKELTDNGYILPAELLFGIGTKLLNEKLKSSSANDIPQLLKLLHFDLDQETTTQFHHYRDNRNKLAHGDALFRPTLKEVTEVNNFLKKIASKVDSHIMEHFIPFKNLAKF